MFENKTVTDFQQQRTEKGLFSHVEDVEIYDHNPSLFVKMLNDGPCKVVFDRVTSGGERTMLCMKPENPSSRNAFDPGFPSIIAVIDLDLGDWRSFYYEQVKSFKRVRKSTLNYQQRKITAVLRGEDWDYMYPGPEGYSLRGEDMYENFRTFREQVFPKPKSRMSD